MRDHFALREPSLQKFEGFIRPLRNVYRVSGGYSSGTIQGEQVLGSARNNTRKWAQPFFGSSVRRAGHKAGFSGVRVELDALLHTSVCSINYRDY